MTTKKIHKGILMLAFLLLSVASWATDQTPDELVYKGKKYDLLVDYLEPFFEQHPNKKPIDSIQITALRRGYIATFEVDANQLFLIDVSVLSGGFKNNHLQTESVFNEIFPNQKRVKVDWFTGIIQAGRDETDYYREYKENCLLEVKEGNITEVKMFRLKEYYEFKEEQSVKLMKKDNLEMYFDKIRKNFDASEENVSEELLKEILSTNIFEYIPKFLTD